MGERLGAGEDDAGRIRPLAGAFSVPAGTAQGPACYAPFFADKDISVAPRRINEIVHGKRAVSADTALRLGRYFGISPQFWLNLQSHYDLAMAEDQIGSRLTEEVHVLAVA